MDFSVGSNSKIIFIEYIWNIQQKMQFGQLKYRTTMLLDMQSAGLGKATNPEVP